MWGFFSFHRLPPNKPQPRAHQLSASSHPAHPRPDRVPPSDLQLCPPALAPLFLEEARQEPQQLPVRTPGRDRMVRVCKHAEPNVLVPGGSQAVRERDRVEEVD